MQWWDSKILTTGSMKLQTLDQLVGGINVAPKARPAARLARKNHVALQARPTADTGVQEATVPWRKILEVFMLKNAVKYALKFKCIPNLYFF